MCWYDADLESYIEELHLGSGNWFAQWVNTLGLSTKIECS